MQVDELQKLGIQIQKNIRSRLQQSFKHKFKTQKQEGANETVISAFGLLDKLQKVTIISIGFGTKSLPYTVAKLYPQKVIKDMHAEILACRGFRKWIIQNLPKQQQTNCYFKWDAKCKKHAFKKQQFRVFIYSSQVFCGDCMIDQATNLFSGAKPLTHFASQTYQQMKYEKHVLRTKPGRLDLPIDKRTLSLSCSDKIALWNVLGLQGKRLFSLTCPIYLDIIWLNCKSKQPKQFEDGINLVKRITMLKKFSQQLVKRKIFNIIINGKQQAISKQFKLAQPKIICLPSKQKQSSNSSLCGIIYQEQTEWLTGKNGILQGRKLSEKLKNSDFSEFSSVNMYKSIIEKEQKFKYEAIKDRIKMLFGIWTDKFKT